MSFGTGYVQHCEITELRDELSHAETEVRLLARCNELWRFLAVNPTSDPHTTELVADLVPHTMLDESRFQNRLLPSLSSQLIDLDGATGRLEVLSLSPAVQFSPGNSSSICALFDGDRIVDLLERTTWSGLSVQEVDFLDITGDGRLELVVTQIDPSLGPRSGEKTVLRATPSGFVRLELDSNM